MHAFDHPDTRSFARMAGTLYLVIAAAGFFSILHVPGRLTVAGDSAATLAAIAVRPGLFAAGVGGDVVMMTAEMLLAAMLLPQAAVLTLTAEGAEGLDAAQRAGLAWTLAQMDAAGVWVWQVFFALHLWLLGVLAWRSGAVPRLLAGGLALGGTGYLMDGVRAFAFPEAPLLPALGGTLLAIVTLAEIGFALWLLTRGRVVATATSPAS